MTDFRSKNVLITGASSGIGLAMAKDFASRGANLILTARSRDKLLELADMPVTLQASGVEEAKLSLLAEEASGQWTANFNPRKAGQAEMESIYRAAF